MATATTDARLITEIAAVVRHAARIPLRMPIGADSRLVEDLAIDSLDLVGVVLRIQDHFDVVIEEDAVTHLRRVADLAAYVTARRESSCSS
jgi:acyl carrier protein